MNYKEALEALKKLENGANLVSAIESEVEALKTKNYEVIGEKRNATQKVTAMETALNAIAKVIGLEGDTDAIVSGAEEKIRAVVSEAAQLKADTDALEFRATEAEGKAKGLERKARLSEIATLTGANPAVLERLLADKLDELKIEGEGDKRVVKLGETALKEAIASDESLKPFEAALFPTQQTPTPKLPGGSPSGNTNTTNPILTQQQRMYGGLKKLTAK